MTRLFIISLLLIGCTCASQPATNVASVAQPPAVASYYLTPADCYSTRGNVTSFWPLLILNPADEFYSFELPTAPWYDGLPQTAHISAPQFDYWLITPDYVADIWDMVLVKGRNCSLPISDIRFSEWDKTYLTLWPLERPGACRVYVDYSAPENYIYATVETLVCDQIAKGQPFVITFYGANLREVSDVFIWYGIWAHDGGYGGLSAKDHEDYPYGLYDLGERNQGTADYDDLNDDSVYAQVGWDVSEYQLHMRGLMVANMAMLRDGHRGKFEQYDFLREQRLVMDGGAAIYSTGVATWQAESAPFAGHSGALCNTVMTIERSGNYVLYFSVNPPAEYPHFKRDGYNVAATCGPPVMFSVHDTAG